MGILAEGERAVATTNRNFLAAWATWQRGLSRLPAVAAASAIAGYIAGPESV